MTLEDLFVEQHQLQQRLEELDAIERTEDMANEFAETVEEIADTLKAIAEDAEGTGKKIEEYREKLQSLMDKLGTNHAGLSNVFGQLHGAAGQVAEGVGQFAETASEVSEAFSDIDAAMDKVRELIKLGDRPASEIIDAFADYFGTIVDKLGPLIESIPGLGTFISIWIKAIERIGESVARIEQIVARNNAIMQQVFGEDLYQTAMSPSQARQAERQRIEARLEELKTLISEHPDNPVVRLTQQLSEEERKKYVDLQAALQNVLGGMGITAEQLLEMEEELAWARFTLRHARARYQELQTRVAMIDQEISWLRDSSATLPRGTTPDQELQRLTEVERTNAEIARLNAEKSRLPRELENARGELATALAEYDEKLAPLSQVGEGVRNMIGNYAQDADLQWLGDKVPWFGDPNFWGVPEIQRIRQAVGSTPVSVGMTAPPAALSTGVPSVASTEVVAAHAARGTGRKAVIAVAALALVALLAVGATTVIRSRDSQTPASPKTETGAARAREVTAAELYNETALSLPGHLLFENYSHGSGLRFRGAPSATMVGNKSVLHSNGKLQSTPQDEVMLLGTYEFVMRGSQEHYDRVFNSVFPCGEGKVAHTLCPRGGGAVPAGETLVSTMIVSREIPLMQQSNHYQFGFVLERDGDAANDYLGDANFPSDFWIGTDYWVWADYTPRTGWRLQSSDLGAGGKPRQSPFNGRIMIQGQAITAVVPVSDLGSRPRSGRSSTFRHLGDFGLHPPNNWSGDVFPAVAQGLRPMPENVIDVPVAGEQTSPIEPIAAFAEIFNGALSNKSVKSLTERLHPAVIERYGEGPCRSTIELFAGSGGTITPTFARGPNAYLWETDGRASTIENTYTVRVSRAGKEMESHFSIGSMGRLRWLTDCGNPR